jgi:AcrR family transcriptional regulator
MLKHKLNKSGQPQARVTKTRKKVLDASGQLFVEQGFEHVSVEHILESTGIARSTFYRLFENKEAVLAELTCPAFVEGAEKFNALQSLEGGELMYRLLDVYVTLWEQYANGMILAVRLGRQYQHIISEDHDQFATALKQLMAKLQRKGLLRNGDALLSTIIIARTAVNLLQIYQGQKRQRELFISAMEGMLLN